MPVGAFRAHDDELRRRQLSRHLPENLEQDMHAFARIDPAGKQDQRALRQPEGLPMPGRAVGAEHLRIDPVMERVHALRIDRGNPPREIRAEKI